MESRTSYQQQQINLVLKEKDRTCPRKRMHNDLIRQLQDWKEEGYWIILSIDSNKDSYKKSLGKSIAAREGLNMKEVVGTFTGKKTGETFFRWSKPIDAVCATLDIIVVGACVMPEGYGVCDHRLFVLDLLTSSLIGKPPTRIIRSGAGRLNTKIPSTKDNYTNLMENLVLMHRLTERVVDVHNASSSIVLVKEIAEITDQ